MSNLSVHLKNYLKLRRNLGFKMHNAAMFLRNFVRFAEAKYACFITTKLALQWASQPQNIQTVQRAYRLSIVRRFAEYVNTVDPRTEVPTPKLLPCRIRRRPPHLYTQNKVLRLIKAAHQIDPSKPVKGPSLDTLLSLLASTGLRVNEALALDCEDIDLDKQLMTIRLAKRNKSRLIPLHASTITALQKYASMRDCLYPRHTHRGFFV